MILRFGLLAALAVLPLAAQSVSFTLSPNLITTCDANGYGRLDVLWSTPGPARVQVHVNAPDGPPLTGLEPPTGRAGTENWVENGMVFVLVGESGLELARATAHLACSPTQPTSFLPLAVRNEWIYRMDSRFVTSSYTTIRVVRAEQIDGRTWFVVSVGTPGADETLFREDSEGRIYIRTRSNGALSAEMLWLDPNNFPSGQATINEFFGLIFRSTTLKRGIGITESVSSLMTGSSGGFTNGLELVRARINGIVVFDTPASAIELAVENTSLDVTGHNVTNCVIPCYYAACGIGSPTDPPGTYKPCFQTRVRLRDMPGGSVTLTMTDSTGAELFTSTFSALPPEGSSESTAFLQLPLYSAPNVPFPVGAYNIHAVLSQSDGAKPAEARATVQIH